MNRISKIGLKLLAAAALVLGTGILTGCASEVVTADAYYPPPAYVASVQPVYYGGRPVYYYGNRWYYRDGGAWAYYRTEPAYLASRRAYYRPAAPRARWR